MCMGGILASGAIQTSIQGRPLGSILESGLLFNKISTSQETTGTRFMAPHLKFAMSQNSLVVRLLVCRFLGRTTKLLRKHQKPSCTKTQNLVILGLKDAELVHGRPSNLADLRQIWHNYVKNRVISRLSHVDHVSLLRIHLTIDLELLKQFIRVPMKPRFGGLRENWEVIYY